MEEEEEYISPHFPTTTQLRTYSHTVLGIVLAVGNAMNAGTLHGGADGFLDYLAG